MSSSNILKDKQANGCTITSYDIQDMGSRGKPTKLEEARKEAEALIREAKSRKEAIEMEAYNSGMDKGQAEGRKMAVKKIEPLFDTFRNALDELTSMRKSIIETHQDQLMEIILLITEKIIHRSIQLSPDIILETVRSAADHLTETDEIRLRLHPSDFEYIREIENILGRKLSGKKSIQVAEDAAIDRGGIVIHTEFGEIDATIRSQIDHMKDMLLGND